MLATKIGREEVSAQFPGLDRLLRTFLDYGWWQPFVGREEVSFQIGIGSLKLSAAFGTDPIPARGYSL